MLAGIVAAAVANFGGLRGQKKVFTAADFMPSQRARRSKPRIDYKQRAARTRAFLMTQVTSKT